MKTLEQSIPYTVPKDFNFWLTVWSSGWCGLAPFSFEEEKPDLIKRSEAYKRENCSCYNNEKEKGSLTIIVESHEELDGIDVEELERIVETCLRLDEDLSVLYTLLDGYLEFRWVREIGAGRCIRSPTAFEDVVKTICSTNCSWALTKTISSKLCRKTGEGFSGELYTFPTPQRAHYLMSCRPAAQRPAVRSVRSRV